MPHTEKPKGKNNTRPRSDRLYRIAWFAIMAIFIGVLLSMTPLLWWALPAALIGTLAPLGIVLVVSSAILLTIIESALWWEALW